MFAVVFLLELPKYVVLCDGLKDVVEPEAFLRKNDDQLELAHVRQMKDLSTWQLAVRRISSGRHEGCRFPLLRRCVESPVFRLLLRKLVLPSDIEVEGVDDDHVRILWEIFRGEPANFRAGILADQRVDTFCELLALAEVGCLCD